MSVDIAFERHAGAQTANDSIRKLEKTLIGSDLPSPGVSIEWNSRTELVVKLTLRSNDGSYGLKVVYTPADDKKPDHIVVTARLADGVHYRVQEVFDLVLLEQFNYTRKR